MEEIGPAQLAEIFVMAFLLSYFLKKYGMRRTLAIGVIAWPIRYIIFSIGTPAWLVIASLALHGFCYVFFFVAAFLVLLFFEELFLAAGFLVVAFLAVAFLEVPDFPAFFLVAFLPFGSSATGAASTS